MVSIISSNEIILLSPSLSSQPNIQLFKFIIKDIVIYCCERINKDYQEFSRSEKDEINQIKQSSKLVLNLSLVCKEFLKIVSTNILVSLDYINTESPPNNSDNSNNINNNSFKLINNSNIQIIKIFYNYQNKQYYLYNKFTQKIELADSAINNYIKKYNNLKSILIRNSIYYKFNKTFLNQINDSIQFFNSSNSLINNNNSSSSGISYRKLDIKLYSFQLDKKSCMGNIQYIFSNCSSIDLLISKNCVSENLIIYSILQRITLKSLKIINHGQNNNFPFLALVGVIDSDDIIEKSFINNLKKIKYNSNQNNQNQNYNNSSNNYSLSNNIFNYNNFIIYNRINYLKNIKSYELNYIKAHEINNIFYYLYLVLKYSESLNSLVFNCCLNSLIYYSSSRNERHIFGLLDCPCLPPVSLLKENLNQIETHFSHIFNLVLEFLKNHLNLTKLTIKFDCSNYSYCNSGCLNKGKKNESFLTNFIRLILSFPNLSTLSLVNIESTLLLSQIINNISVRNIIIHTNRNIDLDSIKLIINNNTHIEYFKVKELARKSYHHHQKFNNKRINNDPLLLFDSTIKKSDYNYFTPSYIYFRNDFIGNHFGKGSFLSFSFFVTALSIFYKNNK